LRITHALPSTSTMGRSWTPVLVYNSAQANGRGVIAADITVQQGVSVSSLRATLSFGQNKTVTRDIPWNSAWGDGISRRISIPFDANALSLAVGTSVALLPYRLDVTSADDPSATNSDTGVVAIVNRAASPFGRGWWLDGFEQLSNALLPDSSARLWVGGDGSVRLYVRQAASLWTVVPTMDRPDTLERVGTTYRRHLLNGAYVEFDFAGHHRATVSASGERTEFITDPSTGALASIDLPVPSGSSADHSYRFTYDGSGRLESIDAPGGRHVAIDHPLVGSATSIHSITDPGLPAVEFDVDG
jgi:YD repeat-containing protein